MSAINDILERISQGEKLLIDVSRYEELNKAYASAGTLFERNLMVDKVWEKFASDITLWDNANIVLLSKMSLPLEKYDKYNSFGHSHYHAFDAAVSRKEIEAKLDFLKSLTI